MLFSWFFNLIIFFIAKENIIFLIISQSNYFHEDKAYFIFSALPEVLGVYVNTVVLISLFVSFITIFHNFISFFSPSWRLTAWARFSKKLSIVGFVGYVGFIPICSIMSPVVINLFLTISESFNSYSPYPLFFEASLHDFIFFFMCIYFYFLFLILAWFGIFTIVSNPLYFKLFNLRRHRRFFYSFFCIFSTVASPPEVFIQLILVFFLIFMFELCVFLYLFEDKIK